MIKNNSQDTNYTPIDIKDNSALPKERKIGIKTIALLTVIAIASLSLIAGLFLISRRQVMKTPAEDIVDYGDTGDTAFFGGDSVPGGQIDNPSVPGDNPGDGDGVTPGDDIPIDTPDNPDVPLVPGDDKPDDPGEPSNPDTPDEPSSPEDPPSCPDLQVQVSCNGCY